jgi:ketosteroid isomerase-like protein
MRGRLGSESVEASSLNVVRSVYGFNWAATKGRETGLGRMAEVVTDDFEAHLSPETGGRVVTGIDELREFGFALEQDFAELTYDGEEFRELSDGRVLVLGRIHGRGRASSLPLEGEFGHVWSFAGGRPRSIEAFLDHTRALRAAGLER